MAENALERINGIKANTTRAAEFVRGLSADLTLRQMDEAVKAAGHGISHARVYQIRKREKLGFKYMAELPPALKPKPAAADFVRGLSAELTLREMEEAMRAAGYSLSHQRIYQIRHDEKLGFKQAPNGKHRSKKQKKQKFVAKVTAREAIEAIEAIPKKLETSASNQVRKLAFQIGIDRLEELIRELKRELGM
jgi:hypothetical protein